VHRWEREDRRKGRRLGEGKNEEEESGVRRSQEEEEDEEEKEESGVRRRSGDGALTLEADKG